MNDEIALWDVVREIGETQLMHVVAIKGDLVTCTWLGGREDFSRVSLRKVETPSPERITLPLGDFASKVCPLD